MKIVLKASISFLFLSSLAFGDIVHTFKNPSFSGIGTGAHYLTIENQESSRKQKIKDALEAAEKAAEREAENTTLAKFIRNLESRIYAQLSKQLVDNMFSNEDAVTFGSFTLEGSIVTYEVLTADNGEDFIQMKIVDNEGTETIIEIPIGTGNFGTETGDPDAVI
jgi:hypothetical protein